MSQLGLVIDSLEYARCCGSLSGRLQLGTLPRLSEALIDTSGSIGYEVTGETEGERAFLELKLEGVLPLICQRCLAELDFPLSEHRRMMLIEPGSSWPEDSQAGGLEDEACEAIEASREMDLASLMEDEILLALPIAPRHECCKRPAEAADTSEPTPFAQLARLKHK